MLGMQTLPSHLLSHLQPAFSQVFGRDDTTFLFSKCNVLSEGGRIFREAIWWFVTELQSILHALPPTSTGSVAAPWGHLLTRIRRAMLETEDEDIKTFCYRIHIKNIRAVASAESDTVVGSQFGRKINLCSVIRLQEILRWSLNPNPRPPQSPKSPVSPRTPRLLTSELLPRLLLEDTCDGLSELGFLRALAHFDLRLCLLILHILRERTKFGVFAADLENVLEIERLDWERKLIVTVSKDPPLWLVAWKKKVDNQRLYVHCVGREAIALKKPPESIAPLLAKFQRWVRRNEDFTLLNRSFILGITSALDRIFSSSLSVPTVVPHFSSEHAERKIQWTRKRVREEMKDRKRFMTQIRGKMKKLKHKK